MLRKIKSVSKEDTNQFLFLKKILDLYLIKIQISFWFEKNSDLQLMKI